MVVASSSTVVRPFRSMQTALGLTLEVDVASTRFLIGLVLVCTLLSIAIWRSRKQRIATFIREHAMGTPGFQRVITEHESLMLQTKEQGNRAYLERDYEKAAGLFEAASKEAVALCKLQYPTLQVHPLALELDENEAAKQKSDASPALEAEVTGATAEAYPPAGHFRTRANAALAQLPTPLLHNLAIFASNRSACLLALNRHDEALVEAEVALHAQPLWSKGYLRAGQAYEGLGLLSRAKAMYTLGARADASDENVAKRLRNLRQLETEVEGTRAEIERDAKRAGLGNARDAPETDRFDALTTWLSANGAQFPYLYLKQYEHDHRGVHTLCRLAAGKILVQIPHACIMTSDIARASHIGRLIESEQVELTSNHSFLACFLLEERRKGADSFWHPYIDTLPVHYRNMPIFFDEQERRWLEGSFTLAKIDERKRELSAEYEIICKKLDLVELDEDSPHAADAPTSTLVKRRATGSSSASRHALTPASVKFSSRHSLSDFIWARTVVITRVFGFSMTVRSSVSRTGFTSYKTDGLVPLSDMLNHSRPRETSWNYDDSRESFVITSLVPFAPRQQVCDSYGRKCNSRFFVNYGFCLEENRDDNQAVLWVRLRPQPPQYDDGAFSTDSSAADALLERKRRILGLRSSTAGAQSLAQSASSLSSSGYVLSTTAAAASSSSSTSASSSSVYPPAESLRFQIPANYSDVIAQEIFSILRLVVASESQLTGDGRTTEMAQIDAVLLRAAPDRAVRLIPALGVRNELAVLAALATAAREALSEYPTTLDQDDAMLRRDDEAREAEERAAAAAATLDDAAGGSSAATAASPISSPHRLSSNQRNCVLMRRGEKEVHTYFISLHEEVEQTLAAYHAQVVLHASRVVSGAAPPAGAWDAFLRTYIEPRYSGGDGVFDLYLSTVLLPLLQHEDERRRRP